MPEINDKLNNTNLYITGAKDNCLIVNGKEYFALNTTNIIKANSKDAAQPGDRYGKEVFNHKTQKHHNWILVDFETGGRGIYPGCKLIGKTNKNNVNILAARNDSAEIIIQLVSSGTTIEILNRFTASENPYWYDCVYITGTQSYAGYVRIEDIDNLEYV